MNKIYPGILLTLLATSNYMTKAASLADVFALEDVVVSASKTAEPVKEAPVPVTLISADMIQRSGARNLRDLLAWYVPGMSMVTDHNEYNISMRGVYASSQQKILIMLNGHRLNGRTYSEANVGYGIGLNKIATIEVLRGPASSLYGNVALAAVINIITKDPEDLEGTEVAISAGDNSTRKLSFLTSLDVRKAKTLVWGEIFESAGESRFISAANDYSANPMDSVVYLDRVKDKPAYDIGLTSKRGKFNFLLNFRQEIVAAPFVSSGTSPNYNLATAGTFGELHEGLASKSLHSRVQYNTEFSDTHRMSAEIYHNRNRITGNIFLNPNPINAAGIRWKDRSYGVNTHFEIDYDKSENSEGTFSYGFQMDKMNNYSSDLAIGADPNSAINKSLLDLGDETILSSYVQVKHKIGDDFIYNVGLRYDSKKRLEGPKVSNASPRVAVIYQQNEQRNYKLSYAESFVDAPYWYRYNVLGSYKGSRDLKPEYLKSWQFTPSYVSKDKKKKYQFNVFYNQLSDFVFRDTAATGNEPRYRNAGKLDSMGYELEAKFQLDDSQTLLVNYTHQRAISAKDYGRTGSDIHNIPSDMANLMWNKDIETKSGNDVQFNVGLNWYGSQISPINAFKGGVAYVSPLEKVSSRLLVQTGVRLESENSESDSFSSRFVDFRIYNLLNEKYRQGGSTAHPYPQAGRTFMVTVGYKF
ncbi:TonB-dependent receptor [bacterium]|nr:TonB-dependent receptor [bacterium]